MIVKKVRGISCKTEKVKWAFRSLKTVWGSYRYRKFDRIQKTTILHHYVESVVHVGWWILMLVNYLTDPSAIWPVNLVQVREQCILWLQLDGLADTVIINNYITSSRLWSSSQSPNAIEWNWPRCQWRRQWRLRNISPDDIIHNIRTQITSPYLSQCRKSNPEDKPTLPTIQQPI